eukprot:m.242923 g.242923  ORF g.242923 m.242923 type:complete len:1107 (-) comp26599_c1_seq25:108-3428(-)
MTVTFMCWLLFVYFVCVCSCVQMDQVPVSPFCQNLKCVVVGEAECHRKELLVSYTTNMFPTGYTPVVFENYVVKTELGGRPYSLNLHDISGQENFVGPRMSVYPQTDVFLIIFSIDNRVSFERVFQKWIPEVTHHCPRAPYLLVGTLGHLRDNEDAHHLVSVEEAQEAAQRWAAQGYYECSAVTLKGAKEVFDNAVMAVLEPPETKQRDEDARKAEKSYTKRIKKTLSKGLFPVKRSKVVFLGRGRAGKTSLLRALQGKTFNKQETSTVYMEVNSVDVQELKNWKATLGSTQLLRSVKSALANDNDENSQDSITPPSSQTKTTFTSVNDKSKQNSDDGPLDSIRASHSGVHLRDFVKGHKTSQSKLNLFKRKSGSMEEVIKKLPDYPIGGDQGIVMRAFDFAGQEKYSVFQTMFVTPQALYLLVFDFAFLATANEDQRRQELNILTRWLSNVCLRAPHSSALLVGTHQDALAEDQLEHYTAEITAFLRKHLPVECQMCLTFPKEGESLSSVFFCVSAKSKFGISELKKAINNAVAQNPEMHEKKSLDHILMQDYIQDNEKPTDDSDPLQSRWCVDFDDLLAVAAKKFRIKGRVELTLLLEYFSRVGIVMYFPKHETLKTKVFTNPQAVINLVTAVFALTEQAPQDRDINPRNLNALKELRTTQRWRMSLLEEMLAQKCAQMEELTQEEAMVSYVQPLIELLIEFDLICIEPVEKHNANVNYSPYAIIPCLLPDDVPSRPWLKDPNAYVSLLLSFPDSVVPAGLFHRLVVRFSKGCPAGSAAEVYLRAGVLLAKGFEFVLQDCRRSNCIRFILQTSCGHFADVWAHIAHTTCEVISAHWSRRAYYVLRPECPCTQSNEPWYEDTGKYHDLKSGAFGVALPVALRCNFSSASTEVDIEQVQWWFAKSYEQNEAVQATHQQQTAEPKQNPAAEAKQNLSDDMAHGGLEARMQAIEEDLKKVKVNILSCHKLLPRPYHVSMSRGALQHKYRLHFKCDARKEQCQYPGTEVGENDLKTTSKEVNPWIKVGYHFVKSVKSAYDFDVPGVVDSLKTCYDNLTEDKSFDALISESFLTSQEQDGLILQLREQDFFEKMKYDPENCGWTCLKCSS